MPFRHVPSGTFDLDTLRLMQRAFDEVCLRLRLSENDARRSHLATSLVDLATKGEREKLAERAQEKIQ
jgi:hypothetical protein